ncbi:TNF receptor-associated factor 4-like isoform X3 [Apostichopus japonicus]|uniref:TNF receptor-associated factor 4-like isoform X3 n=1 Tax=Stichopus japonicus TaxID=307972 RepID=UPI003AB90C99
MNLNHSQCSTAEHHPDRDITYPIAYPIATHSVGIFKCPEDDLPLDYAKIYPDNEMASEIQSLQVRCSFYKDGCKWVNELKDLKAHLESCQYNLVACTECAAMVSRNHLKDHLHYDCTRRRSTCRFCGTELSGSKLELHLGQCQMEEVFCENKCGAEIQRRFLQQHMEKECPKRAIPCKFCHKEFVYETLQNHLHQCPRYLVSCPNRCEMGKVPREDMEKHTKTSCSGSTALCPFSSHGCKHKGPKFNMDKHVAESTKEHLTLMCKYVQQQQKTIERLQAQVNELSLNTDGQLLWKIDRYSQRVANAKSESEIELCSPPFFTGRYGYKLQVSLFPNGNGSGEGSHLSVYVRVMCGEYDSLLKWPFTHPISFTLLDQADNSPKRMHIKESFKPEPTWKNFQRPSKDVHTLGYGYPTFVSHVFLKTRHYVKNDVMFLRVKVDYTNASPKIIKTEE